MSVKLLVVDDHPLFREGICSALKASGQDFDVIQAWQSDQGADEDAANSSVSTSDCAAAP